MSLLGWYQIDKRTIRALGDHVTPVWQQWGATLKYREVEDPVNLPKTYRVDPGWCPHLQPDDMLGDDP